MHRFAYSTNAYTRFPLRWAVRDIARAGFDGIEILADVPHAFPGSLTDRDVAALESALRRARLKISNLNGNTALGLDRERRDPDGFWPSFLDADPLVRRMRTDYVLRVVDLARALGAPNVCTASGRPPRGVSCGRAERYVREAVETILRHAERKPVVRVGLEFEPGFLLGETESTLALLDDFDHPLLGVNLDIGHAVCAGEDPAESVAAFRGRIWNLHVEDIRGRVHRHLIPGEGEIDFTRLKSALDRAGYDRFLTLELYPYKEKPGEAGRRGLKFLKPLFTGAPRTVGSSRRGRAQRGR